jgi:hypothetical protein
MKHRLFTLVTGIAVALFIAASVFGILGRTAYAQDAAAAEAIGPAAAWLVEAHQNADGGYTAFSTGANASPSDAGGTVDALLALAATGQPVDDPLSFLESQPDGLVALLSQSGGSAGKAVIALALAGADPSAFAGLSPVISLTQQFSPNGDANVADPFNQALAILGVVAAGEPIPPAAVDYLISLQAAQGETAGSWDDGYGTAGNIDATAMAVMALYAAGMEADSPALQAAGDFLTNAQLASGGWGYAPGMPESANSTALGLQALVALGRDITAAEAALLAWQQPSGAFAADFGDGRFDDFFTTLQALPALTLRPYPLTGDRAESAAAELSAPLAAESGDTVAEVGTEREQTNPVVAWILIALALAGAAAVYVAARYRGA